jgi:acetoin utilization protein AcuB
MSETLLVRDVMTPSPLTIEVGRSVAEALALMRQGDVRHLPVVDDDAGLVGVLSERDVARLEARDDVPPGDTPISRAMTRAPWTVGPMTPLEVAVRHMASHRLGSSVVVENARVVGILTTSDGLRALAMVLAQARAPWR